MSLFKLFLAGFSITAANAKPVNPSKVTRADPPSPSTFPLGDACGNEWRYLNFDPENETDKARLQKLHDVLCIGELRAVSSWGSYAASDAQDNINHVYDVFFSTDNDTPAKVRDVLRKISGESSDEGKIGKIVGTMIVDNKDFSGECSEAGTQGYTDKDEGEGRDGLEKIHFCDVAWDFPTGGIDIDCGTLDKYPSTKMDAFSRLALHETLHYSTVGPDSLLKSQIVDAFNDDEKYAYGPERAAGLNDPGQDNQPAKAEINADNYAWMALDAWISYLCTAEDEKNELWDSYFPDDPPDY